MDLGWPEILIIAVVILVLFGSKKMPDAARSLGRSLRILKTEVKDLHHDDEPARPAAPAELPPAAPQPAPPAVSTPPATTATTATTGERPDAH
jgi:sec-independent protein translocase protein TatA